MQRFTTVSAGENPKRLDVFLSTHTADLSRAAIQRLIEKGAVMVNGKRPKPSQKIKPGDEIAWDVPKPEPLEIGGEPIPLDVLFEDDALLVLNKPAGIVVHPAPGHWSGTLVNALLYHMKTKESVAGEESFASIGGRERPGLVHRLDKGTSGVMVIAKTDVAHQGLSKQFKAHTIHRVYLALVIGAVKGKAGRVDLAIGRDTKNRKLYIFKTLMTYRATPLSPYFVQALNLIDVEFYGNNDKEKAVRNAWKVLLDHFGDLSAPNIPDNAHEKTATLTTNLLIAMGKCLGYDFDEVQIKKGAYYPMGLGNVEQEQHAVRRGILDVLSGKRRIPVGVFEDAFPEITLRTPELKTEETKALPTNKLLR